MRARRLRAVRTLGCLALALSACTRPPTLDTPEQAHAALAKALNDPALAGAFDVLDLRSRWAVMTIHRYEREMHELVAARFREPSRSREMARYRDAAEAKAPADWFVRAYRARLLTLRSAVGAAPRFVRESGGKTAKSPGPGGTFLTFARGDDGRWAWSDLGDELEARKVWSTNALQSIRDSVARLPR